MTSRSRTKIRPMKSALISMLYNIGIKPRRMVNWFGVSRATIYRHIKR